MPFPDDLARFGPGATGRVTRDEAVAYCASLAATHYENFSVATWLTPRALRPAFRAVYAFCRWSDDLGDEVGDPARSAELLAWWRGELRGMYRGEASHPVMIALAEVVESYDIPIAPFEALISAFEQDQTTTEYATYDQLLDYCTRSADPVGHLVLRLAGAYDEENARLADATSTGLQLANFWQDVARDKAIGRVYLPREDRDRFGYADDDLARTPIHAGIRRAAAVRGRPRPGLAGRGAGPDRPDFRGWSPSTWTCSTAAAWRSSTGSRHADMTCCRGGRRSARWRSSAWWPGRRRPAFPAVAVEPAEPRGDRRGPAVSVATASERFCEDVARREAKNFYASFRLLPTQRRGRCRPVCLHEAHRRPRRAPGPAEDRRAALDRWRGEVDAALAGGPIAEDAWPGMAAWAETVRRHEIPGRHIAEVLDGVADGPGAGAIRDVRGPVCLLLPGGVGGRAVLPAHLGLSLRWRPGRGDGRGVRHRAATDQHHPRRGRGRRRRPRLPAGRGHGPLRRLGGRPRRARRQRPAQALLAFEARRARAYYAKAEPLRRLVAPVGRPVFAAIAGVYEALLDEIERRDYEVLSTRARRPGLAEGLGDRPVHAADRGPTLGMAGRHRDAALASARRSASRGAIGRGRSSSAAGSRAWRRRWRWRSRARRARSS